MVQALVKELQSGKLPLVRATGPFGCSGGHKWGGHQVMVIFAGGIGVGSPPPPPLHPVPHAAPDRTEQRRTAQLAV